MEIGDLLVRCQKHHAVLTPEGDDRLRINSPEPLPDDLRAELRQHKSEILALLRRSQPQWHAQEIAQRVAREGICLFWSDLFGETVAFIRDDSQRGNVPADLVAYTSQELLELFGDGKSTPSPDTIRIVHEAKKQGGHITSYETM